MPNPTSSSDPLWYKDAIIYELHVKAFYDSNNDGIGDFPGLTQKLDYLENLGVTCIWLLPFYPSPLRDDGYDISNYHDVHPSYGTLRDFRNFVRQAHHRKMRVITELVINHTSDQHPWFQAARQAPPGSSKRNFYVWSNTDQKYQQARIIFKDSEKSNWAWDPVAKAYYWHRFFHHQPDLNFDSPAVRRAVMKVMRFWLDLGVDGLRLDAVPYLMEREGTSCENLAETHVVLKAMRKELDAHYKDRVFLAEANQWPADVRPYFGEGDECHMAFHFPLMPRMFMAVRQEDRHPITEIMRQTPDIPENCQWALFLRNHDELTLEMVTHEERDYMYKEYATDPLMHLNLGIRRRLAPLLGNSLRQMELLYSLLLSFPGTPVLYYGDELGMGDNVYLGDRGGVRTPMQWSADRNAGFSRADFAQLYCPPIMDPVYGYEAINVEGQLRDASSFLSWMKRMIALSKRFKTFGRGTLEFLNPTNRKVLVYVRRYQDDISLFVANLSRYVQPAEVDLSAFEGLIPVEMLGSVPFPRIGKLPYFLTLGPHAFYWFHLQRVTSPPLAPNVAEPPRTKADLYSLTLERGVESLFEGHARYLLESKILPLYLQRQRWYGEKAESLKRLELLDWCIIKPDQPIGFLCWAKTYYVKRPPDTYLLTLGIATGPGMDVLMETQKESIVASVQMPDQAGLLHEGLSDDGFCQTLLHMVAEGRDIRTMRGVVRAFSSPAFSAMRGSPSDTQKITRSATEQSNSSIRYGDRLFLKLFRRMQPGLNPDLEIGRYLTEHTSFDRIAKTAGGLEYASEGQEPITLSIFEELITNQGSGWEYTLDELGRYFERVQGLQSPDKEALAPAPLAVKTVDIYLHTAEVLGKRTGELHQALSQNIKDPAFSPEPLSSADIERLVEEVRTRVPVVLGALKDHLDQLPAGVRAKGEQVLQAKTTILEQLATPPRINLPEGKIRCHGDFHLSQVLWKDSDFFILDFEGEPARPLTERRAKQSPLRDIAGMLRSFHYAAYTGLTTFADDRPEDINRLDTWAKFWIAWSSASFLKGYTQVVQEAGFYPRDPLERGKLLRFFLWEKVLYELSYELNNRPRWVHIPLEGILSFLTPVPTVGQEPLLQPVSRP